MSMDESPTVVDLFCGGGGFSEGFRQAGFEITHAVDYDQGACDTYELNSQHSDTEILNRDLMDSDDLAPSDLPDDVDILIGSPPCTQFSWANNGGSGDKEEGKSTVKRFFEFVAALDPDYWLMENVPNSKKHVIEAFEEVPELADEYKLDRIIDSLDRSNYNEVPDLADDYDLDLTIDTLYCEEYGTPQRRRRFFFGEFPEPEGTEEGLTLGQVLDHLPSPNTLGSASIGDVEDPVYDLKIDTTELTDHFYDAHLTEREAYEVSLKKENHSVYGRMSFPDQTDDQSRTILAMRRRLTRETVVVQEPRPPLEENRSEYRELTLREAATIQGFPITYQFHGDSISKKWRRIGDAVPPTVAYRIAAAIGKDMGMELPAEAPIVTEVPPDVETDIGEKGPRSRRKHSIKRSFQYHVPYDDKRKWRVDVENYKENPPIHPLSTIVENTIHHPIGFKVVVTRGYASNHEQEDVPLLTAQEIVDDIALQESDVEDRLSSFYRMLNERLAPKVPDATTLQAQRSRRIDLGGFREYELLKEIANPNPDKNEDYGIVDEIFPQSEFSLDTTVQTNRLFDGAEIPIRVAMKILAANYLVHKLNHCSRWMVKNANLVYLRDDWGINSKEIDETISCRGGAHTYGCIEEIYERFYQDKLAGTPAETIGFADD